MEAHIDNLKPLLEKAETYSKTSLELIRLKTLDKAADVSSTFFSRLFFIVVALIFAITINIAIALWLGDVTGKAYYGFLMVAGFYAIVAVILLLLHPNIKSGIRNAIIKNLFN
jgi:hypothetical protein